MSQIYSSSNTILRLSRKRSLFIDINRVFLNKYKILFIKKIHKFKDSFLKTPQTFDWKAMKKRYNERKKISSFCNGIFIDFLCTFINK